MSSPRTSPAGLAMLTPQLLAEAAVDPGRTWAAQARCTATDLGLFFPPADALTTSAQQICDECPVQAHCLAYAVIADEPFGIWGGFGPQSGILCGDICSGAADCPPPARAPGLLHDAGTAAAAGADRRERALVTADGPRGPGRRGPGRHLRPAGAAGRSGPDVDC